jgi:ABC-type phosphate/phosphonate transport system substrate-binding protein
MRLMLRLITGAAAALLCLAWGTAPVLAAAKTKVVVPPHVTPPGLARKAAVLAPLVFQVNPAKVNPTTQTNIVIIGQHLSATTRVQVGGHPATTVEAPDPQTLLVKLPEDLAKGSYAVSVTNEAGTTVADQQLVVDDSGTGPNKLTTMAGVASLLVLVLVMRLARTPGLG